MEQDLDDYSPSSTTVKFNYPIPLLRGPTPAGPPDNPSSGPYVLAFKNPQSWASAYQTCKSKIIEQCEGGARIGCAIAASNKCKPPWWHNLFGGRKKVADDLKERERCEEHEMQGCLAVAKEKCVGFANDKCWAPFRDARIAVSEKEAVRKLVSLASTPWRYDDNNNSYSKNQLVSSISFDKYKIGVTNYKASELLGADAKYGWFLSKNK